VRQRAVFTVVVLAAVAVLVVFAVVRMARRPAGEVASEPPIEAGPPGDARIEVAEESEPGAVDQGMRRLNVLVYFPSSVKDVLAGEPREIFMTAAPGDRAKQILADLISGPESGRALRAVPRGTQLQQVYVLEHGTAYVDFSAELKQGLGGGSTEELFTVYSIVNSVALNIPEIRRVGILINGRPVETLNGHVDLRRPLPPNLSILDIGT
jgi:spore germination protein GerM